MAVICGKHITTYINQSARREEVPPAYKTVVSNLNGHIIALSVVNIQPAVLPDCAIVADFDKRFAENLNRWVNISFYPNSRLAKSTKYLQPDLHPRWQKNEESPNEQAKQRFP